VLIDAADTAQWQALASAIGWQVIAPMTPADASLDARIQSIDLAVTKAIEAGAADSARIYLAGRGAAAAAVFYTLSRVPDLWAAAVALGGSPQPAIDSDRLYAANFANVPVLWVTDEKSGAGGENQALAEKLKTAGIPLEWRSADKVPMTEVSDWLARNARPENPLTIDCETNSPTFARCYWIRMTKFDAAERNDVLPSTQIQPGFAASLDLGSFGFKPDAPGPGVLVAFLPEKYSGPLKMGDRIVALDGREIADAKRYSEMMRQIKEERPAVVMVQRGKERIRIETNIVLPKRAAAATARVQANYSPSEHEIQIISRTVTEMRVTIPQQWLPVRLNWNGVALEKVEAAGCRLLTINKEIENTAPCP